MYGTFDDDIQPAEMTKIQYARKILISLSSYEMRTDHRCEGSIYPVDFVLTISRKYEVINYYSPSRLKPNRIHDDIRMIATSISMLSGSRVYFTIDTDLWIIYYYSSESIQAIVGVSKNREYDTDVMTEFLFGLTNSDNDFNRVVSVFSDVELYHKYKISDDHDKFLQSEDSIIPRCNYYFDNYCVIT